VTLPHSDPPETRRGLVGPFTGRQLAATLGVVLVAAIVLVVATHPLVATSSAPAPADPRATQYVIGSAGEGLHVGDVAPELEVVGPDGSPAPLRDISGQPVRLADLRGHPAWITFWASWCPPCQAELPVVRDAAAAYARQGLAVLGISVQEATAADVRAYAQKYGLDYTVAADLTGEVYRRYKVFGLPTHYFLDANGVIRSIVQGPVTPEIAEANLAGLGLIPPGLGTPAASPVPASSAAP